MSKARAVAFLASLVAALVVALPAQAAAPVVQEHYDDVFDILVPTVDDEPGSTFCGLLDVPLHGEVHGYFSVQSRGTSDFVYFADRFRASLIYTNPDTGLTFRVDTVGTSMDIRVVDNGDGTLTITTMFAGVQKVYAGDELVLMDRGVFRETFSVYHMGTVDPDDDEDVPLSYARQVFGPHETLGRDFCDDFFLFTTP